MRKLWSHWIRALFCFLLLSSSSSFPSTPAVNPIWWLMSFPLQCLQNSSFGEKKQKLASFSHWKHELGGGSGGGIRKTVVPYRQRGRGGLVFISYGVYAIRAERQEREKVGQVVRAKFGVCVFVCVWWWWGGEGCSLPRLPSVWSFPLLGVYLHERLFGIRNFLFGWRTRVPCCLHGQCETAARFHSSVWIIDRRSKHTLGGSASMQELWTSWAESAPLCCCFLKETLHYRR